MGVNFTAQPIILKDSIAFEGRTPCNVPGVIATGIECYKLKWYIILYGNTAKNEPGTYKILGTPWRKQGGRTGNWIITSGKDGRITYQLNDDNGKGFLYLLNPGENILVFTDANGRLLTGNADFSYTLNRRR
ncbi:MAG: hypothetical protein WDO16_20750 [Bacteroidota bacterium]